MKNKKPWLIGGLVLVVVVALAAVFGGNYFQGSIYNLSTKVATPTINPNISKLNLKITQPTISKAAITENLPSGTTLELAKFNLGTTANTYTLTQLRFDLSSMGVSSISNCHLYDGTALVANATTCSLSEVNFDGVAYAVNSTKTLILKADLIVYDSAQAQALATSLASAADTISWDIGSTHYTGKGANIVNASINWVRRN